MPTSMQLSGESNLKAGKKLHLEKIRSFQTVILWLNTYEYSLLAHNFSSTRSMLTLLGARFIGLILSRNPEDSCIIAFISIVFYAIVMFCVLLIIGTS